MEQQVLDVAVLAGKTLLSSGAEIFRVQETISRIIEHFGVTDYNVYVIANGIFVDMAERSAQQRVAIRHVPKWAIDMARIEKANQVARELCAGLCTLDEAEARLNTCQKPTVLPRPLALVAGGFGAGCFCFLYGGDWLDALAAFFLGLGLECLLLAIDRMPKYLRMILGAFVVTFGAGLIAWAMPARDFSKMVIGAIMALVPGVAFTTGIRELFGGDYVSASVHLLDAVTVAGCIAIGVSGAIMVTRLLGGVL